MKILTEGAFSCAFGLKFVDKIVSVSLELWSAYDLGKQKFCAQSSLEHKDKTELTGSLLKQQFLQNSQECKIMYIL